MLPKTESACFAIADISGYTNFVAGVELDHAQDIIADIMDTLVKALRPPFRLAKFEGDAAFVYALADKVDGSLLQDSIEAAYCAFRKRLRNIRQANSCVWGGCSWPPAPGTGHPQQASVGSKTRSAARARHFLNRPRW